MDEINGVLYINRFVVWQGGKEIKVTYTYGRTDLPQYVKELCKLLVVRDLLMNERFQFSLPESEGSLRIREQLEWVEKRIAELEELVRAIKIPKVSQW